MQVEVKAIHEIHADKVYAPGSVFKIDEDTAKRLYEDRAVEFVAAAPKAAKAEPKEADSLDEMLGDEPAERKGKKK